MRNSVLLLTMCISGVGIAQPKALSPNASKTQKIAALQARKKLFDAIKYNNLAAFKKAIATPKIDLNTPQRDFPQHTPLLASIYDNRPEMTKLLLAKPSVDVNRPSGTKMTFPLHWAGIASPKLVAMLLAHPKINPNLKPASDSYPALFTVVNYGDLPSLQLFLSHPKTNAAITNDYGETALFPAVQTNQWHLFPALLATGKIDVNAKNVKGSTILHEAVTTNNLDKIRNVASLEGIDPNLRNAKGETPLDIAIRTSLSAVNTLLENKATVVTPENQKAIDLLHQNP